ncbi:hypothetical protein M0534_03005 [Methylonatrum kenyense]|uniref:hypothetical protein n=1 Tax=Methylonatrum kenyense TaxID=455253 RepID=UPI0020BD8757|nr:hypothetical protein [Methylonatrum kenyense]MCK8515304.1 hypothetical protein [Methylonatrum kenyense]
MAIVDKATRERLTERFARGSVHPDDQTRITLFVQSVKAINSAVLAHAELQGTDAPSHQALHQQYFKEVELATLLGKATAWSSNPLLYMEATNLNLELWNRTGAALYLQGLLADQELFYRYLALSHALLDVVRFAPFIPEEQRPDTPFLQALLQVEADSARECAVQAGLLETLSEKIGQEQAKAIRQRERTQVEACFKALLDRLGA